MYIDKQDILVPIIVPQVSISIKEKVTSTYLSKIPKLQKVTGNYPEEKNDDGHRRRLPMEEIHMVFKKYPDEQKSTSVRKI